MAAAMLSSDKQYFDNFSSALRYWRGKRGYSQLHLSSISRVSQRHISFLESGRSQPSKDLILKLGIALDVPLRQRNVMLLAAGFAPAYQERKLADPELAVVRQALDFMLAQQAPYPALVVDRLWNLQLYNQPAEALLRWLLNLPAAQAIPGDGALNVLRTMLSPDGVRPYLVNFGVVGADALHWIQREAMGDGPGSEASALLSELAELVASGAGDAADAAASAASDSAPDPEPGPDLDRRVLPFLPLTLSKDGIELNLFTTIATLGTPRDVTVHELRIESFFPADEPTRHWFQSQASQLSASKALQSVPPAA